MSEPNITKRALAASMKELMSDVPLSKITVYDIVKHCGLNRQTFYYHFKDKYDLVNWIYYTETIGFMGDFTDREHWTDGLCKLCIYMKENKKFYINALNDTGQNSFSEYLLQFLHELILSVLEELKGNRTVPAEELQFISDFYSFAFLGLISKWAKHGMKEDPREYVGRISDLTVGNVLHKLEEYDTKG